MKCFFIVALAVFTLASGVELYSQTVKNIPGQEQESKQNSAGLLLPPALYAVPGTELNVYFDNIVVVPDIKSIYFDVDCKYGRQDQERWRFIPEDKDAGSFPLTIKVYDTATKLLGEATATVFVSPKDAGKGKSISVLLVGDSLTNDSTYPKELFDLFKKDGMAVKFIGSHTGAGKPPREDAPSHEGYGGWTWRAFCTKYAEKPANPADPAAYRSGSSPFVFLKDDSPVLDFKTYCDRKNDGKAPDYICITLGANEILGANDSNIRQTLDDISTYADMLISEFKRVGPSSKIAIGVGELSSASQDSFGENYKCGMTRWQYRKYQSELIRQFIRKFAGREKENIFILPIYHNIDCVNNFLQKEEQVNARNPKKILRACNGVHPATEGYLQMADSFYGWFKYELNRNK